MKKWETKKNPEVVETKLVIILKEDDVVVEVHWNAWGEKDFADYLVEGVIPTFYKIMNWMEVPDGLKLKIYTKWINQISKILEGLDLHSNDEEEDG